MNFKEIKKRYYEYKLNRKTPKYIRRNLTDFNNENFENVKVLIIVPFRDPNRGKGFRTKQLNQFVNYYHNYGENIQILIIEQSFDNRGFNRGALMNIGFDIGKLSEPDVYIFHDVDLMADEKLIPLYHTIPEYPLHIANLWKEKYDFYNFFGGINSFNKKDYEKINGFPNTLYGWGQEDNIILDRIATNDLPVIKPKDENKNLIVEMEPKKETKLNIKEELSKKLAVLNDLENWQKDGLNSLNYKVLSMKKFKYDNVHKIKVLLF